MKKVLVLGCMMMLLGSAASAGAACTQLELLAKAQDFQQTYAAAAQKDPQKTQEATLAMQKDLPELQKANDVEALCKFYDDWTKKLK
jgi:hypothetical protein